MKDEVQTMNKHITDEKTGISYTLYKDYYLPDLTLPPEEKQPIGMWGQQHLQYLRQNKQVIYTILLTSGKLNSYLADIDKQAEEMFSRLINQMAESDGITEELKMENQMLWVGKMNVVQEAAREIVNNDLIYA